MSGFFTEIEAEVGTDPKPGPRKTNGANYSNVSMFDAVNLTPVARVLDWLGVEHDGKAVKCPQCGNGFPGDTSCAIVGNAVKCSHNSCADAGPNGYAGLRTGVDLTMLVRGQDKIEAVKTMAAQFGIDLPRNTSANDTQNHDGGPKEDHRRQQEKEPAKPLVEWITAKDIFAQLPPATWISRELQIGPGRPTLLAGYGASGKTLIAQSLALSVAAGIPAWGKFHIERGRVVHTDMEQGFRATARRYQRLGIGLDILPQELEENLIVACLPRLYLTNRKALDEYARVADGAKLVIIDSLRVAVSGCDENDSKIRDHIDELTRISEQTGAAFMLLHHAGKPKDGHTDQRTIARGSSAIFDACGAVYVLTGPKGGPKSLSQQKCPADVEGAAIDDFLLEIEDVPSATNPTAGVRVVARDLVEMPTDSKSESIRRKIVEYVTAHPNASKRSIRSEVGGRGSTVDDHIEWLIDDGQLEGPGDLPGYRVAGVQQ